MTEIHPHWNAEKAQELMADHKRRAEIADARAAWLEAEARKARTEAQTCRDMLANCERLFTQPDPKR